jgi:hypothetical protein
MGIHLFGTLSLFQIEGPRALHALMLTIDLLVVIGLLKKTAWGYWLAVLLYVEQSTMQPYWGYQAVIQGFGLYQLIVVCPLVIIALVVLAFNKKLFVRTLLKLRIQATLTRK